MDSAPDAWFIALFITALAFAAGGGYLLNSRGRFGLGVFLGFFFGPLGVFVAFAMRLSAERADAEAAAERRHRELLEELAAVRRGDPDARRSRARRAATESTASPCGTGASPCGTG